jgi:hypothetical protein
MTVVASGAGPMSTTTVRSACECQARLEASLDEKRQVLGGWAVSADGTRETAPAHSIDPDEPRFDVAWLCPACGRNTVRGFFASSLVFR